MATMEGDVCATPPSALAYYRQVIAWDPSRAPAGLRSEGYAAA